MSRFLSHRELKAANRALGDVKFTLMDAQVRLTLLEKVVAKLLQRSGLELVIGGPDDLDLVEVDVVGAGDSIRESGLVGDAVDTAVETAATGELEASSGIASGPGSDSPVVDGTA